MKKMIIIIMACITASSGFTACSKKQTGFCYCKYLSGDKKDFDLSSLERSNAEDSCHVLDGYAAAYAGSCKLK